MSMTDTTTTAPQLDEYASYSGAVRWAILAAVMLGTLMEVVDTSIVNVAIPNMMGNLGVDARPDQLGVDRVHHRQCDRAAAHRLAVLLLRTQALSGGLDDPVHRRPRSSAARRTILNALVLFRILQGAGGAALLSTAQATMMEVFPPAQIGHGAGHLRHRRDGRADHRPHAGRLDHR